MPALFRCLFLLLFAASALRAETAARWEQWDGCKLLADRFYDGDSFQIQHGRKMFVLRLYFADAPETADEYAARVDEQAAYFGIAREDVLRGGGSAKEFAAKFLAEPFRVITRRQAAPGASRAARIYAVVERDGWTLDAALIQNGLARATSEVAAFPDDAAGRKRADDLRRLEQEAAQQRKGLWAKSQRADRQLSLTARLTPKLLKGNALPAAHQTNLNTATQLDLEALPGIGPKTATAIIRARPLRSFEALDAVPGLGPKKVDALRPLVSFE